MAVARAEATAAAAVSKQDDAAGALRQAQIALEQHPTGCDADQALFAVWVHWSLLRSDREGEGLRDLAGLPFGGVFQRLDRPRLIEVKDGIELLWQPRVEVVAHALGFGAIDDPDRPLEPRIAQGIANGAISHAR